MITLMTEQAPTRSAVLELEGERAVVHEAYDFLDEKRLLLAAELLRQLERYEALAAEIDGLRQEAVQALADAVARHGLEGLTVYPARSLEQAELRATTRNFMGVTLAETQLEQAEPSTQAIPATNPSPEAEHCRNLFTRLSMQTATIAGTSGNLYRLLAEYLKTERRARALENVILPEIENALRDMNTRLEEIDQEEAVRVRLEYSGR